MLTYFANYIKEWWHPDKPKSNTHQKKTSIEGELKVTCYDSNGKTFVRLSAEFPVSSQDIAKDVGKMFGAVLAQFSENEIRIGKVDDTFLGGRYEDVQIIQYRDHSDPYEENHTTSSSSSSSSSQDDIATTGHSFSPMEIEATATAHTPSFLRSRFHRRVKNTKS
jgi:hypothetical protein